MAKKIIYLGLERCDYIYHLATSLGSLHRVLVCDNSFAGDLYSSVNKFGDETYSWLNIDFNRNISARQGVDDYDYILIYAGERMEDEYLYYEDSFFLLMPQCSWQGLRSFKDMCLPLANIRHVIIVRDYFSRSLSYKSIGTLLDIQPEEIEGYITNAMEDSRAYLSLTHNGKQNPKYLSPDMREALIYVLSTLQETDRKTALLMLNHSWAILKKRQRQAEKQTKLEIKTARREKKHGYSN